MRELARQRTKELQEEEDERTKRQMARALAKLEELNKRTLSAEEPTQKLENASSDAVQNKQDESRIHIESSSTAGRRDAEKNENDTTVGADKPSLPSSEAPKSARAEPKVNPARSAPMQQVAKGVEVPHHNNAPQVHETNVSKPKRESLKQKHTTSTTEAPKIQVDVGDNDSPSAGVVASEVVQGGGSDLPINSNVASETSVHSRKKNSRNGKNKHKTEDKSAPPPSSTSKESLVNVSLESGQPETASLENRLDPGPVVQVQISPRDVDQSSENNQLPKNEDSHGRGNSHWKPQQSRRMPRNQQSGRPGEKHHGGDGVVWAPVRPRNKTEVVDEPSPQNVIEAAGPPMKPDNQVQNTSKNKRAEMERYVPKPVAKEMAQQGGGNTHQPVAPLVNPTTTTDDSGTRAGGNNAGPQVSEISHSAGVAAAKAGVPNELRSGNNRHGKQQGKAHGSWRQRGSTEQEGSSYSSNVGQNVQKSIDPPQPQKPEPIIVKDQEKNSEVWDDWGISEDYVETVTVLSPPVKDQKGVVTGRGKRHSSKGQRGNGNTRDHDQKKSYGEDTEKIQFQNQSSISEMSQMDQSASSKENRGDHSMPHWQPKPQVVPTNNQRGNRHNSNQNYGSESNQAHRDQSSVSERGNAEPAPNHRHHEARRERKAVPLPKGQHSLLANRHLPNPVEQEQRVSSGFHKNGNQNARFSQNHEAGDWNYSEQDNRQHNNPPPNRERARQNQRYEYQPVGPYNNRSENFEGPKDGYENLGSRGRGRGQNHSRRGPGGSSYGRQGGIRIETSFE